MAKINKNEYTRYLKKKKKIEKSYLDYLITLGINNIYFNIVNESAYTDHKALKIIFVDDEKRKLDNVKGTIEPYIRVINKIDEIKNKIKEIFIDDIPDIKLLRLIHDNKYKFKSNKKI